jgi:CO/xanthine dehydrogenase Mo-binding subunit
VADVRADGGTVWSSTQGTHGLRNSLARILNIPAGKLRVIYMDGSGSYGGNGNDDVAADAALISKTIGKPVRVQWMRQDEHGWDPKGPQQLLDLRGGLDANGHLLAWETHTWLPMNIPGTRPFLAFDAAGISQPHGQSCGAVTFNTDPPYETPNVRVITHWMKETPLRPSNLRAPGKIANVFAVECFTDELAAAAGVDPLAFRLRGMTDPRAIDVVKRASEMVDWQPRPSPNPNARQGNLLVGRGLAYARYKGTDNYVAMTAEVEVNRATGQIHVKRIACAHDAGLVINQDSLRNQVEGNIVQTLSRTLHEEIKFDHARVTSVDWVGYPLLRFPEVPVVNVALMNHPDQPPMGGGEAASVPVAAAVGNAFFDATGVRLRTVPFAPERVKAALEKA